MVWLTVDVGATALAAISGTGATAMTVSRTAFCRAAKTSPSRRKRTSAFVGCTFTSTSWGGTSMSRKATG